MYEFLDRLLNIAILELKILEASKKSFDGKGNYTLGLKEQTIFQK